VITFFGESVRFLPIPVDFGRIVAPIQGMVYGAVLILIMLKRPEGLLPEY
jgi:branched-chain amino acid transport system permease protein